MPGAGAVEIELARQIETIGECCEGFQQYAIKKFALALDTLPKQLVENAGLKVFFFKFICVFIKMFSHLKLCQICTLFMGKVELMKESMSHLEKLLMQLSIKFMTYFLANFWH